MRKNASIIWEKYKHQFLRLSPYDEFCCIFLYYGKLIGKPMHFLYDKYTVGWKLYGENSPIL